MKNILNIVRFIVQTHEETFKVFIQKKLGDGSVGRPIETIHKIDEKALYAVEQEYRSDLMYLGIDPDHLPTDEEFKALPKGTQVEFKKAQVRHDNRQMAVVKEWANEKAVEYGVPVCYMGPANVLAQ
jgi:hypothetical protein